MSALLTSAIPGGESRHYRSNCWFRPEADYAGGGSDGDLPPCSDGSHDPPEWSICSRGKSVRNSR